MEAINPIDKPSGTKFDYQRYLDGLYAPQSPQSGGSFNAGPNEALQQWAPGIQRAAELTGLDPNLIGGMVWAESRGDPNTSTTNVDGTTDGGLMQISQERWNNDVVPNLTEKERARIKELTGKEAEELDMSNPEENLIGGAFEIQQKIKEKGSVEGGLKYYVSGDIEGVGSPNYVQNVLQYQRELASGQQLSEDPHGE
ncbi:transglycosylase SLT domain-containing protein [Aquabacterium sp. A7-Y]|uniref:transglycosylase SLT domain-containing protein n=1 Tax=Aquabacterium sp. A7-Y TaxID=1349605 RepID=UPI00223E26F5|nr:transglycosylase SLT domain-containing protein [Aquabacterium sp. A7-Y]MCW7541938.1 transglycosylase SLT domain-containing protein [Aquabacterium sp. A7-Y]